MQSINILSEILFWNICSLHNFESQIFILMQIAMCHWGLILHLKQFSIFIEIFSSHPHSTTQVEFIHEYIAEHLCLFFTLAHDCLRQSTWLKKTLSLPITIDTMCDNAHVLKVIAIFMAAVDTEMNARIIDVKLIVIIASATDGAWWNYIGKALSIFLSAYVCIQVYCTCR